MSNHRVLFLTDNYNTDDYNTTESWLFALEQFGKTYSVTSAHLSALLTHEAAKFDLIVIEVERGTIADALQTCQRLRSWTNKPILVLSSLDDENFALDVYKAGADEYVVKPISIDLLHAKLQAWQRWSMPMKRQIVSVRPITKPDPRPDTRPH
jgi:DNA-binding response OmpR family regulator